MTDNDTVSLNHVLEGPEGAPVLVFSNSLGTSLRMWDEQAAALVEHFRLLRYDHRGHGRSSVPPGPYKIDDLGRDLLALLDHLEIERAAFCGLSLGGMVGMWLASHAPERVSHLVLCCTSARLGPPENWTSRAKTVREEGLGAVAEASMERWFTPMLRESRPGVLRWAERMLLDTPVEGYAGCCEAMRDMDLTGSLGDIQAPTLVVAGADDPVTPPDHAKLIVGSIPGARLTVVGNAAHLANVEQPEKVTREMLEHLVPMTGSGGIR
ncbi:MAG: 3-oxoadipate enol-lactonase [Rubrobacteraceae bacterium]